MCVYITEMLRSWTCIYVAEVGVIGMGRNWENKWPGEGAMGGRAVVGVGPGWG